MAAKSNYPLSFNQNEAGSKKSLRWRQGCLGGRIKNNLPDNNKHSLSQIPQFLRYRIRAFHARGRGSIPCGGDNKIGNSKTLINKLFLRYVTHF